MRVHQPFLAAIAVGVLLAACGGSSSAPASSAPATSSSDSSQVVAKPASPSAAPASAASTTGGGAKLTGAGSTFDFPLFSKVFDAYQKDAGTQVNYQSVGSGAGIEQLTKKTVDFGASDAIMTDEQEKAAAAAGGPVLHIPVTMGAVAVGYNLPNVKGLQLDADTLTGIYLGTIKSWDDPKIAALNPDLKLPKTAIAPVERSDGSGTTYIFTNYLSAVSSDWKSKVGASTSVNWPVGIGGKGSEGVAGQVSQTPGAIGYFELAYAKQNNLNTIVLKNQSGKFVEPSVAGATAAAAGAAANMPPDGKAIFVNAPGDSAYPISGFSWALVYQNQPDATKGKAMVDLLTYLTTNGQNFAEPLYYAPLPQQVKDLDSKLIESITIAGKPQ